MQYRDFVAVCWQPDKEWSRKRRTLGSSQPQKFSDPFKIVGNPVAQLQNERVAKKL